MSRPSAAPGANGSSPRLRRVRGYRLELFLPANTPAERRIARRAIQVLRQRYGGATHSSLADVGAFGGEYEEGESRSRDQLAYLLADTVAHQETRATVEAFLDTLLTDLHAQYHEAGVPQEAVMATVQPVTVYLSVRTPGDT